MKLTIAVVLLALGTLVGVATSQDRGTGSPKPEPPKERNISYYYDGFEQTLVRPLTRVLDPSLWVRKATGNHREAENVDAQDQVRLPSTWWQPRLGFRPVTVEQMLAGPGTGAGPAPGPWTVVRAKTEGVSKGFQIKDSQGARFAIKLDPKKYPELATTPDVICSRLYWAAGYNVPDNTIAFFRREDLQVGPDATYEVAGRKVRITPEFIDELLEDEPKGSDGRYRVVASKFISGKPLGEWRYEGRRSDDPEDLIPHELRREIRGSWAVHAWLNNTDASARNTLDMWVTDGGRSFVRHHLIDFSGALGSGSIAPQTPRGGNEHLIDFVTASRAFVSLALPPFEWERADDPGIPSVGFVDSEVFDPEDWKAFIPNPAFDVRTDRDARWGARIVAAFSDAHIEAAVKMGRYSDPRAHEYIVRVLRERRDKLVQRWLTPEEIAAARAASGIDAPHEAP